MKDTVRKSEELFELYEKLADQRQEDELEGDKSLEDIYAASQWRLMWRKFIRNKAAMGGGLVILCFYLVALLGNFIAPYGLTTRFRRNIHMPPQRLHLINDGKFQPFVYHMVLSVDPETLRKNYTPDYNKKLPVRLFVRGYSYNLFGFIKTDRHLLGTSTEGEVVALLGTDHQGRDMFSRIILGSQVSLTIGLVGVFLSLLLGAVMGIVSGYYGGLVDNLIQRLIELIRSFPSIPLWMSLSAAIPQEWSVLQTYFAISVILSLIGWTWLARQLRGLVLALRNEDFVLAAKLAGASDPWIIFRHLIPATFGQIVVVSTLAVPSMILAETALSYLGLGLQPPITSWGVLIQEAQNFQSLALYPWVFTPAIAIAVCILAFNYLGDGMRDAIDPYTM
jgi:peptide/nickel transport system permease protein